jgi:hypothetical protein
MPRYCLSSVHYAILRHHIKHSFVLKKRKKVICEFSETRQCAKVILGVDGTAAGFFAYFFDLQQKSMMNKHQIQSKMSGTMPIILFFKTRN